jgi:aerobic carbon-monoxide dehydrogenase medium subunit
MSLDWLGSGDPRVIPKKFDYHAPDSVDEAIRLLGENAEAKVLAGGQSLLALMKLRIAAPAALVDISRLHHLSYVRDDGSHLAIGALTTHDTIERNRMIRERFAAIGDAVARIGDQQIRNLGTIGGSACHADPAADLPTALLAVDAQLVIQGKDGGRVVTAPDFFLDFFATAVGHDEILTEIRLPYPPLGSASAYMKHSLREADFAIAMAGAAVTVGEDHVCRDVRIAFGAAGPTPLRALSAERYLKGKSLGDESITEAAERAIEGAEPPSDVHGSREYRLEMIKVLTKRSLKLALSRVN